MVGGKTVSWWRDDRIPILIVIEFLGKYNTSVGWEYSWWGGGHLHVLKRFQNVAKHGTGNWVRSAMA